MANTDGPIAGAARRADALHSPALGDLWMARKRILRGVMAWVRPQSGQTSTNGLKRQQIGIKMSAETMKCVSGFIS